MEKLNKKEKHNHNLTNWLKFGIFAILMLTPFFSVLARTMYVVCNKNAKESYTGSVSYITQMKMDTYLNTTETSTIDEYRINNQTRYKLFNYNVGGNILGIKYDDSILGATYITNPSQIVINCENLYIDNIHYPNTKSIQFFRYNTLYGVRLFDVSYNYENMVFNLTNAKNSNTYYRDNLGNIVATSTHIFTISYENVLQNHNFSFTNIENNIYYDTNYTISKLFEISIYYTDNTLSNVFEYSINNLKNQNLYNWTKNTGIYNAINNMVIGLGANEVISILLTYWSILTAIYIVFDIIIAIFVKLTHLINE